jgi:hypothetical protein
MSDDTTDDDLAGKGNDIKLPDLEVDRDDPEPAWSPDNDLSKDEPTLGDIPEKN